MAVFDELAERAPHRPELLDFLIELADVVLGHTPDVRAGAAPIAPEAKELRDLLHREPEVSGATDEPQRVNVVRVVNSVAGVGAAGLLDQADRFVMTDHLRRHARLLSRLPDVHASKVKHSNDWKVKVDTVLAGEDTCRSIGSMSTSPLTPVLTADLPAPVGPYSPGIIVGNLVFVSGQAGRDPLTGHLADDVEAQTEQTLRNVSAILERAGSSLNLVVRCGVFLVDMTEFQKMNGVYARMFGEHRPARTTVEVSGLPGAGLRVEIDAVGVLKQG